MNTTDRVSVDQRLGAIARELIEGGITKDEAVDAFERKFLGVALDMTGGNVTQASAKLGCHRNTVHNLIRIHFGETRGSGHMRRLRDRRRR